MALLEEIEVSVVDRLLYETVERLTSNGPVEAILRDEAERIVLAAEMEDPDALLDWFRAHMVSFVRERLRVRLAGARAASRRGAFSGRGKGSEDVDLPSPFSRRYAVEGDRWIRVGDMVRPDWNYLIEDRSRLATANLFEVELARQIVKRMPDDQTPTSAVATPSEFERLERAAIKRAGRSVTAFRK